MAAILLVRGETYLCTRLQQSLACSQRPAYGGPAATAWIAHRGLMGPCKTANNSIVTSVTQHDKQRQELGAAANALYFSSSCISQHRSQTEHQNHSPTSNCIHLSLQQERINHDGSLTTAYNRYKHVPVPHAAPGSGQSPAAAQTRNGKHCQQELEQQQQQTVQRLPGVPAAAPTAAPISPQQLSRLVELIQSHRRVLVLTGAGCSTESNIPDYRGPTGAYTTGFTPMTHQQFVAKKENRARYWARSFAGWHEFAHVAANAAHDAIARLQQRSWLGLCITQNVDRLHLKGGSSIDQLLELHGTTHRVVCLDCGANTCRQEMQQRLASLNPQMAERVRHISTAAAAIGQGPGISSRSAYERALSVGTAADARKVSAGEEAEQVPITRPDGDVELADAGINFKVPPCDSCGGDRLKPDVVFFGDSVPRDRVDRALSASQSADLVLVVGSSLMVWSAFRLVKAAKEAGAKLAIVNVGPTRADDLADIKVEALAGEVMLQLAMHPNLMLPRI